MKVRLLSLIVSLIFCAGVLAQQLPVTSQIEPNQTFYNPGAVGNQEALTAVFTYRQQMKGFEGAPSTQVFSAHAPLKNPDVAMGVVLEHDVLGSTYYTGVYLNYAYRIDLGINKLSFGLKGGINSGSPKYIALRDEAPDQLWNDQNSTFYVPNFGVGVLYYGKKYWAGVSVPRLFIYNNDASDKYHIKTDFSELQYFLSGGARFALHPEFNLDPSLLFMYCPNLTPSVTLNVTAAYRNTIKAGLGFRYGDALMLLIGYNLNRQFSLGYSYDYEIGKNADFKSGSHEINILYKFGYQVNASNPRQF